MTIRERLIIWLAWRLPRIVAYWAFVRVQTANYGGNPSDRSATDAMKSWDGVKMTDGQLLAKMGTDASKWTDEFLAIFPEGTNDWGTLAGGFANAIEAGRGTEGESDLQADMDLITSTWRMQVSNDFDAEMAAWMRVQEAVASSKES